MPLTVTFTGDDSLLTVRPGQPVYLQSTTNRAAVLPITYTGNAAAGLAVAPADAAWGTDYELTLTGARVGVAGRMAAFRESRGALERRAAVLDARARAAEQTRWLRYPWR